MAPRVIKEHIKAFKKKMASSENDLEVMEQMEKFLHFLLIQTDGTRILPIQSDDFLGFYVMSGPTTSSCLQFKVKFASQGGTFLQSRIITEKSGSDTSCVFYLRDFETIPHAKILSRIMR